MADQLTSIGVEFSKVEMNRIFYELRPGARAHKWGLGPIRDPGGATAFPDKAWGVLAAPYRKYMNGSTDYPTRKPGGCMFTIRSPVSSMSAANMQQTPRMASRSLS